MKYKKIPTYFLPNTYANDYSILLITSFDM